MILDLGDLLSSLSKEDMNQLRETAAQLLGNIQEPVSSEKEHESASDFPMFDPRILSGISKYFGKINEKDNRCDFLYALKPLLQESRQKRVDEAVNILRMTKLMEMLKEGGLLG